MFAFTGDAGQALKNLYDQDFDSEATVPLNARNIIRRDILTKNTKYKGTFESNSQQHVVPESLRTLVAMILGGPDIKIRSSNMDEAQTALSISRLMFFNSTK